MGRCLTSLSAFNAFGEFASGEAPGENLEIKTDGGAIYDVSAVISDCLGFFKQALGLRE
jgi:hypothetical protein